MAKEQNEAIAQVLTILIPVIMSVIVTILVIIVCCCWIHSSNLKIEKESIKKVESEKENPEFELENIKIEGPKRAKTGTKRIQSAPKIITNDVIDESQTNDVIDEIITNDVIDQNKTDDVTAKKVSTISDPGYQANLKHLLRRPQSTSVSNGPFGPGRPNSANIYNSDHSRPLSVNLRHSRSSSASSHKSTSLNGPYLTEPIRHMRSRSCPFAENIRCEKSAI